MSATTFRATINAATTAATVATYGKLPALPILQELAGWLRELNRTLQDGGCDVWLYCQGAGYPDAGWRADNGKHDWPGSDHCEVVPGEGKPFDATAAARRLLSEARCAGFK
jgi:hypothetical protein